jgi:hypothetical protein
MGIMVVGGEAVIDLGARVARDGETAALYEAANG